MTTISRAEPLARNLGLAFAALTFVFFISLCAPGTSFADSGCGKCGKSTSCDNCAKHDSCSQCAPKPSCGECGKAANCGKCGEKKCGKCADKCRHWGCEDKCRECKDECGESLPMKEGSCITPSVPDQGCWDLDPKCCPREDYCLLCGERGEFKLLCCAKPKKCCPPKESCKKCKPCKCDECRGLDIEPQD